MITTILLIILISIIIIDIRFIIKYGNPFKLKPDNIYTLFVGVNIIVIPFSLIISLIFKLVLNSLL